MRPKIRITGLLPLFVAALAFPFGLQAQTNGSANIAATDVLISGSSLALEDVNATTGLNIPVSIQTSFGGLKNEQAPVMPELTAVGDLTGPGIETPIQLQTAPGHSFTIPGLSAEGVYLLQNVRLMRGGTFVQNAVPSSAAITVADILKTKVSVRQLTAAELRARGIMIDARNFDVYEYTLSFFVGNEQVFVPFPVIVDKRTHEVTPLNSEPKYSLPGFKNAPSPPRWGPPRISPMELVEPGALPDPPPQDNDGTQPPSRPSIPAAIVIPNSLGVLHSFFAVALSVTNNAPTGSSITLDSITATMKNPPELRVADTKPAVSFGRPVPLVDPNTGNTILIAQGEYNADWTLEGLKTGTHTFTIEVHATYKASSTADPIPLRGVISEQLVIHDPRFNITFSHPDTVRAGLTYSTFTFVTNMTSATQTIRLRTGDELPACSIGGGADVCRLDDDISNIPLCSADTSVDVCRPSDDLKAEELTLKPGATRTLVYKLRSNLTGNVFATAGSVDSDVVHAAVQLHMGVSTSGIPLSPATLVMPYYAQYLDQQFVADNLQLLGLGYSLATAPVNQVTAAFPRVITTDVFHRAVDIARAGQRIFIGEDKRDTLANLTLDLLGNGNGNKLIEWDELRRKEYSGRIAGAALGRQHEAASLATSSGFDTFLARFGQTTAHRAPYLVAVTHGAPIAGNDRPYALSLKGVTTHALLDVPNELATEAGLGKREVAFGDLTKLTSADHARTGEMAAVGLWSENYELTVTPAAGSSFTLDVLYPSTTATRIQHAVVSVTNASGRPLKALLDPSSAMVTLLEEGGSASYSANATTILPPPLAIVAAHQDLHLDDDGHKVSVLFNRPVDSATDYKTKFAGKVNFHQGSITYNGPRGVDAAALQDDERTLNLTFDHSLSTNAAYSIQVQPITDPLSGSPVSFTDVVPVIDNNRPAGIIYGRVLRGDNSIVPGAQVTLRSVASQGMQYDVASSDKADFLFEYILRDLARGVGGAYVLQAVDENGKYVTVSGAIRLTGIVETVNLVYLGRGSAEGRVTYDNGEVVPNAKIVIGSTLFNQFRNTTTGSDGRYHVNDLPVGPLTFSATDASGNSAFAASEIRSAGEIVTQDLSIYRQPFPGTGKIRGIVVRSDNQQPVPNAHVGVYTQGFGLADGYTDADGRFEFDKVVSGLVTVLAEDFSISRKTVGEDFDLANDQVKDLTLTLEIVGDEPLANLEGDVEEENPLAPGTYSKVPGALVQIQNMQVVTADANGHFVYKSLQLTQANKQISVYNPASKRTASTTVPTLDPLVTAYLRIPIRVSDAFGTGTVQVRVLNAGGQPVSNLRVFEPGYPTVPFHPLGNGKYELRNVGVGSTIHVWAITTGDPNDPLTSRYTYGDQYTSGDVSLAFNGQTSLTVLRLQGQGKVRVRLFTDIQDIGNVNLTYRKWDDEEQGLKETSVTQSTKDPSTNLAGYAIFDKVPAAGFSVFAALANFGYDSASRNFAFDGQVLDIDLHAKKLASLAGVVYAIDGITPMPNVPVKMTDGAQTQTSVTALDGSFKFGNVAAGNGFTITAETTVAGISRVGRTDGVAPPSGGPMNNISVVMKQQGSVEGFIVYSGYKVFDPTDPSKNVLDTTPNDPSDNARVPLAQFFLRELSYPYHFWGKETAPLTADINGHFIINNVFVGDVRLTGWSQQNQDLRGDGRKTLVQEGSTAIVYAEIGAQGFGPLAVTVVDPNKQNQPVENAEVALAVPQPGGPPVIFDFGTTDASGTIRFEQVPARNGYELDAFSKTVGKSGTVTGVNVLPVNGASAVVSLEFSGSVNGTLTDPEAANAGVPGVPVILKTSTYQQEASTAVNGSFFLGGIHEGTFVLDAMQESSRRRAHGQGAVSAADPNPTINLELEHTSSLYVKVFYPNDDGSMSNIEVPTSDVDVRQRCKTFYGAVSCEYTRTLQGNGLVFTNLMASDGYGVTATEIGGDRRTVSGGGSFPLGATADNPFKLKLPAFGTVEVTVRQPGPGGVMQPATGARVGVSSKSITTDTSGVAIAHNVPLGDLTANAVSFDGLYSAYSPVFHLGSQSTPLKITLDLAASAGIKGLVNAETGGPSVQTRVVAGWPGHSEMTLTDATGAYKFQGIAVSSAGATNVSLTYYGPDDKTVGAAQVVSLTAADVSTIKDVPAVTLDATPPTIVTFKPDDNSINVTPDTQIVVAFSEPIAAATIHNGNFRLQATDGSAQVTCGLNWIVDPVTGLFTVTMTPPASTDPAQRFPLKSNMLYRVTVASGVADLQGHPLAERGFTFITADYVAPKVILLEPATNIPLSASTTFQIHFNKPLASELFSSNHNIVAPLEVHLFKLGAQGGTPVSEVSGSAYGDLANQVISFAPSEQLAEKSYYRLTLTGVRDKVGNVADTISFDYVSYDRTPPFITFEPLPTPAGTPLVSGIRYTLHTLLRDGSATGAIATDVQRVEFSQVVGTSKTLLASIQKAPFEYSFTAPNVTTTGTTLTFHVDARDTSLNDATPQEITFDVAPNLPPQNVTLTLNTADPIYPGMKVSATPSLSDEGLLVTLQAQLTGTNIDGTTYTSTRLTGQANRTKTSDPWVFTPATFEFVLPATLADGSTASIGMTASDGVNAIVNATPATFTVAADTALPVVSSVTVSPAGPYNHGDKYTITAIVKDAESGIADLTFTYDGITTDPPMKIGDPGVTALGGGTYRFVSPQITASTKNEDTRIAIIATARDLRGNKGTGATEVTYVGVHDTRLPRGAWVSPIGNAAWPSDQPAFTTTLRVWAKDDESITGVKFVVPGITDPVVATLAGGDVYTAPVTIATPAAGSSFTISALISDADSSHTQTITIPITLVHIDTTLPPNFTQAITSTSDAMANTNVLVKGPNTHLVMHVPFTFKNLIVVDGGSVETLASTTSSEKKLDLTVKDTLYVDSSSFIDVSGKGYLGGWAVNPDSSGTKNEDARGRTIGNSVTGGPTTGASASHGGVGGESTGITNRTYGSITNPRALGTGGAGNSTCCTAGGTGGGAAVISSGSGGNDLGRIIVAGTIKADGLQGSAAAGAGGSIAINGRQVSLGYSCRITANGGDDAAGTNVSRGGGGGRVAVIASEQLESDPALPQLQARGGRNLGGEGRTQLDAGAGTVYVRRPGQSYGELILASLDERFKDTTHLTRHTVLGYTGSGSSTSLTANTLTDSSRTFVTDAIGEELLLGGDTTKSYTITTVSADGHTLTTDSADGSLLAATGVSNGVVTYTGLLAFDAISVSDRALARFDDSIRIGGIVDDASKATVSTNGVLLLRTDIPVITSFTSTPADGAQLTRGTTLNVNYNATSAAGIGSATLAFSPVATPFTDTYNDYASPASKTNKALPVATNAPLDAATLTLSLTDRAGRKFTSAPLHYTVIENQAPAITKFDVTPASLYAGHTIAVDTAASDDFGVTALSLTTTPALTVTPATPVTNGTSMTRTFTVAVPAATPSGTSIQLNLAADDAFPHTTTQQKSVAVLHDPNPPVMTVGAPTNQDQPYLVGSNVFIPVKAVVTDAEVGVSAVYATLDGVRYDMSVDPSVTNGWKTDIPVPWIDGSDTVTKPVIVYAKDYDNNLATSPTITVKLSPNINPQGPLVSWICPSSGALFPVGYTARVRVTAVAGKSDNAVTSVTFYAGTSNTPYAASNIGGTTWEGNVPMPAGADGDQITLRVVADSFSHIANEIRTTITLVTGGQTINSTSTISSTTTSYDNDTLIITAGPNGAATTVTIDGPHTFTRLLVLDNATVVHSAVNASGVGALNVTTTGGMYLSCLGNIDVSGRGYQDSSGGAGRTWPNTFTNGVNGGSGASHGGVGGQRYSGDRVTPPYDSMYDPSAPGSAGAGCNAVCNQGGGVVRLKSASMTIDGKIYADGLGNNNNGGAGAGGAIRIDTGAFAGNGEIRANGAAGVFNNFDGYKGSGGGGRIAVYYRSSTFNSTKITAAGGQSSTSQYTWENGTAGSVYLQQTDALGAKTSEELIVDNSGRNSPSGTTLASFSGGTVSSVSGTTITLSGAVPDFITGSWIEILDGSGNVISSYEITARTATTVTVRLAAGDSAVNAPNGSGYRNAWKLDRVTVRNSGFMSVPQLRLPLVTTDASSYVKTDILAATDVVLHGNLEVNGALNASTLKVENNSLLSHSTTNPSAVQQLNVNVTGTLTVDATSSIDASGRGYQDSVNGAGRTWNNTTSGGATGGTGASHGGIGGQRYGGDNVPAAYGSVLDPAEPGGSGAGCNGTCNQGGGVIRIKAGTLQLNGKIQANGYGNNNNGGSGAGGSVRIIADTFSGTGEVHADGAAGVWNGYDGYKGSGGGGRIAVWHQTSTFDKTKISAAGGQSSTSQYTWENGTAGTVYFRQTDPNTGSYTDELVIDNLGRSQPQGTPLPTVGGGTVTNINGAVVTLSNPVGEFVIGSTIEFLNADGSIRSSYTITARTATTVTVALANGESAANTANGASYRGVWVFSQITMRGAGWLKAEAVKSPAIVAAAGTTVTTDRIVQDDLTVSGGGTLISAGITAATVKATGARLEVNGVIKATTLRVENSSVLSHSVQSSASIRALQIDAGSVVVDATSSIDVSGRGYQDSSNGTGRTYPYTFTGGSTGGAGASHGGVGAARYGGDVLAATYGSAFDPDTPGGAGEGCNAVCNEGGGVARIKAGTFQLDGKIYANGFSNNNNGGAGAGGSVRVDAGTFTGTGEIHTDGGAGAWNGYDGYRGSGGGGRIAVYYTSMTFDRAKITSAGGYNTDNNRTGAPGTIFFKQASAPYGELVVANNGRTTAYQTRLISVGYRTVDEAGTSSVKDAGATMPDKLAGIRLILDWDKTKSWPIVSNTAETLNVDVSSNALTAAAGQPFRGMYRFDRVTLRNANLAVEDLLEVTDPIDKVASTVAGSNAGPPVVDLTKISIQPTATGASAVGAAGAVVDSDAPVAITLTNTAFGTTFTGNANADGSFIIGVQGDTGNSITLKAKDTQAYPIETQPVVIGTLASGTPVATQINRTAWTSDAAFLPRTLAIEGNTLAVASRVAGTTGNSDKVVILDITDPTRPVLKRVISTGSRVLDIKLSNNWLYVANNRFSTFDLSNPTSTQNFGADQNGNDYSLAVTGGYAFTAEEGSNNDGRINVYDVSNPASPRFLYQTGSLTGVGTTQLSDLIPYGSDYLVGISSWGRRVVVIDRRNVNALTKVGDLPIANFDAFRGTISGSNLYLFDGGHPEMVVVSLANPGAPVIAGRITIPAPYAWGAAVVANDVIIANDTAGLTVTTANPASLAITGSASTGGAAWDVEVQSGIAYVANETGVALVPVGTAPVIHTDRISLALNGSNVVVTGLSGAVTGGSPVVSILDTATNATVTNIAPNADGSFTATLAANPGDPITLTATSFKSNGPVPLGLVPFATAATTLPITSATTDGNWRARLVRSEGNNLVLAPFPADGSNVGTSDKLVLYDISNPAAPVYKRTITTTGRVLNVKIVNGWAFVAGNAFGSVNLNDPSFTFHAASSDPNGVEYGLAVVGGYAFTGESDSNSDGRINVYDVTNPAAPRFLYQTGGLTTSSAPLSDLIPYGTDYLVGLTYNSGGANTDVYVIDKKNVNALFKAGSVAIPNMTSWRGKIVGSRLYVGSYDGGSAIVDLSIPTAPVLVTSVTNTPISRGNDLAGSTLAVANGATVGFYDVSANTLRSLGSQPVNGVAWDVVYGRGQLYVAADTSLVVMNNIAAAPVIDTRQISVGASSSTSATVTGLAYAVTGNAPFTAELKDVTSGASISVNIAADGSFNASLPALPGETLTLTVTDAANRVAGPLNVGVMPFGTATAGVQVANPGNDANWRARIVRSEANNLILASFPDGATGTSDKLVLFDISNPAAPVLKRTIPTITRVLNVQIVNGWAYVAGDRFGTLNLNDPNSTINLTGDPNGRDYGLAIAGGYAFTGEVDNNSDGRINIYDITIPGAPRFIRQTGGLSASGAPFTDLIPYGTDYLVGITYNASSAADVYVIDRKNVNGLFKVSSLVIPNNISAFRGKIVGSKLYLGSYDSGSAIVDLSNPSVPVVVTTATGTPISRGVDLTGSTMAVANGAQGATFYDVSANTLRNLGQQPVGGVAWDVSFNGGNLYVANDLGLVVIQNTAAPPVIDSRLISVGASSATMATVSGSATAITGLAPLTTELKDTNTGATISVNVAANGSFSASLPSTPGDTLTLKVTDANNRVTGPLVIGTMPFGTATTNLPVVNPGNDANWRARLVRTEGNNLVLAGYPSEFGGDTAGTSDKIVLFDISNPAAPVLKRTISTVTRVLNMQIVNGYAYVVGDRFGTVNLNDPNSTFNTTGDPNGRDYSIAVSGGYAFTGEVDNNNDGRINIYDVTNPAAPRFIRQTGGLTGVSSYFSELIAYGNDYLIGINNNSAGNNLDVYVIDRKNVNGLVVAGSVAVPNMASFRGKILGSKLYLGGFDSGSAIVDLTNPKVPVLVSSITTTPMSRGVDIAGATLAVANGSQGVTFYDVSAGTFSNIGRQSTAGIALDVAFNGANLYVANDQGLVVIQNVVAPPRIDARQISIGTDGTQALVHGNATAVTGLGTISLDVKDAVTSAIVTVTVNGDGSFDASLPANGGDTITLKATDSAGRIAGPLAVGTVPFGTATSLLPVVNPNGDANWRARIIRTEGNNLVLAGYPSEFSGDTAGTSDKIVLFDISNPASPVIKRTIPTVTRVLHMQVVNGWAYVSGDRFGTVNLNDPSSTFTPATSDPSGREYSIAVTGGYAFLGEVDNNNDGRINVYDVTAPGTPRFIYQTGSITGVGTTYFSDLIPYGTNYLIGINSNSGSNPDVYIIDRRDARNLFKVGSVAIPNMTSFRGKLVGTKLYVSSFDGGTAIVDVSNPAAPSVVTSVTSTPISRGSDLAGTVLAVANGSAGIAFYDVSANTLRSIGTQPVGGTALDCSFSSGNLYVANDQGLVVIQNATAPPDVRPGLIAVTTANGTSASVIGSVHSIGAAGAATIAVTDTVTGATISGVAVNSDGSFSTSITAKSGEPLTLTATDGAGRTSTRSIGAVPFFAVTNEVRATRDDDAAMQARRVATDGTNSVTTTATANGFYSGSDKALFFLNGSTTGTQFTAGSGTINDVTIRGNWAYFASDTLSTVDMSAATLTRILPASNPSGRDMSIALVGNYAVTGEGANNDDARLNVYDVTNPAAPVYLRQNWFSNGSTDYYTLIPYNAQYLIGLSSNQPGVAGDVAVFDVSNIASTITRVKVLDIPSFSGNYGALDGTWLYVVGYFNNVSSIAIVDMSVPTNPVIKSTIATPGFARKVAVSGTNEIVVADSGGPGLTFIDVTDKTHPVITGSQQVNGNPFDVKVVGRTLYVGAETRFMTLQRP